MARLACSCFRHSRRAEGKREYENYVHYDHSSTLKTLEEIFDVEPLLGAAARRQNKGSTRLVPQRVRWRS